MATTSTLAALKAKIDSTKVTQENTAKAQAAEDVENVRIFKGDFPESVAMMTPAGKPVYFYKGHHATKEGDVIEYLSSMKHIKDVTDTIKPEDVPTPPERSRGRTWHSAAQTEISPAELLQRVVTSRDVPQAMESNGT